MGTFRSLMCLAALAGPITAHAQVAGGGPAKSDCYVETQPCFPTGNPNGQIVRTGSAAPPTPPFPDPTYPKTGNVTLVATFCEGTSGAATVDLVTGLPGPGALVLPMTATWMP